jgi:hypothetical protein
MSSEKNSRDTSQWSAQLEQGRQKLSASMEEALADVSIQDDEEWEEEDEQMKARVETADKTAVIPPRLSLQSKVLPAVQVPDGITSQVTKPLVNSGGEVVSIENEHKDSVFMRLARRLTASFAAFGVSMQPDVVEEPAQHDTAARPQKPVAEPIAMPPGRAVLPPEKATRVPPARPEREKRPIDVSVPLPFTPSSDEISASEQKRRLARTTRVRLETVSAPISDVLPVRARPAENSEAAPRQLLPSSHYRSETVITQQDRDIDAGRVSGGDEVAREARETSVKLPVVTALARSEHGTSVVPAHGQFFGRGTFEGGQGDRMVEDSHVTEECVIFVMLTGNPGPVVVHYISLYPGVGFTVHLTAPVSKETAFNYIIFSPRQA